VLVDEASRPQVVDGIDVQLADDRTVVREHFEWSDIVVAQLKTRQRAIFLSARYSRPLAYLVQIGNSPIATLAGSPDLTVFSSRFVQEQYPGSEPSLVVHPLVPETEYLTTPGDRITLINLAEIKGGRLFFELADRQPEREFLGVAGWGKQVGGPVRPNVSFMRPASDVRSVYARTRVLLMPSSYESYGRVALEAAVSGIPTIAHPAGGLVEALGDAGLWADRDDPDAWIEQLRRLDDPEEYAAQSRRVRERFERLNPQPEIDALETALVGLSLGVPVA
jgi:glycosyltransferase involved in cell wall biosynthesis